MSRSPERISSYRRHFEEGISSSYHVRVSSPSPIRREGRAGSASRFPCGTGVMRRESSGRTMSASRRSRMTGAGSGAGVLICVGPSGEAPMDLDAAALENAEFKNTRTTEKEEMIVLNDRLAVYIDKVRSLEQQNKLLEAEIEAYQSRFVKPSGLRQLYEEQLRELRKIADQMKVQRDVAFARKDSTAAQLAAMKLKYEEAIELRRKAEAEIEAFRPDVDQATSSRIALEKRLEQLEVEIEFLKRVHQQEIEELMKQIYAAHVTAQSAFALPDLAGALKQIQNQYDDIAAKNLQEMDSWYKNKFQDLTKKTTRHVDHVRSYREGIGNAKKDIQNKEREMEALQTKNEALEAKIRELQEKHRKELGQLQARIESLQMELKTTKEKIALHLREYQDLLNIKMALEIEITTYRKLIEGEDLRLAGMMQTLSLAGCSMSAIGSGMSFGEEGVGGVGGTGGGGFGVAGAGSRGYGGRAEAGGRASSETRMGVAGVDMGAIGSGTSFGEGGVVGVGGIVGGGSGAAGAGSRDYSGGAGAGGRAEAGGRASSETRMGVAGVDMSAISSGMSFGEGGEGGVGGTGGGGFGVAGAGSRGYGGGADAGGRASSETRMGVTGVDIGTVGSGMSFSEGGIGGVDGTGGGGSGVAGAGSRGYGGEAEASGRASSETRMGVAGVDMGVARGGGGVEGMAGGIGGLRTGGTGASGFGAGGDTIDLKATEGGLSAGGGRTFTQGDTDGGLRRDQGGVDTVRTATGGKLEGTGIGPDGAFMGASEITEQGSNLGGKGNIIDRTGESTTSTAGLSTSGSGTTPGGGSSGASLETMSSSGPQAGVGMGTTSEARFGAGDMNEDIGTTGLSSEGRGIGRGRAHTGVSGAGVTISEVSSLGGLGTGSAQAGIGFGGGAADLGGSERGSVEDTGTEGREGSSVNVSGIGRTVGSSRLGGVGGTLMGAGDGKSDTGDSTGGKGIGADGILARAISCGDSGLQGFSGPTSATSATIKGSLGSALGFGSDEYGSNTEPYAEQAVEVTERRTVLIRTVKHANEVLEMDHQEQTYTIRGAADDSDHE